jgi:polyisoprenoid-binding protein YceI
MKKTISIWVMLFAVLLTADVALAEAQKWEIDNIHSNIYFDVRHIYASVRGQFDDFSGTLQFNPDNLEVGRVIFEVRTKSINTRVPKRDNHLRSEEFFAVSQYPLMTFQSTGVKKKQGNQYTLEGNLTLKGKTRQVAVPFTYFGTRENPLKKGQMIAGFEARFSINRLDYGVGTGKFFEMGAVGNRVDLLITIEVLNNK